MTLPVSSTILHPLDFVLHRWLRIPYALHASEHGTIKKPSATIVLIHGIGNSERTWDDLLPLLPPNARIITIDLLGFGQSPRPAWVKYNAKTQARSVAATLVRMRLTQQPIIVGHSLGALVAVDVAKRYPFTIKRLILCSPPFYSPKDLTSDASKREQLLQELYRTLIKYPSQVLRFAPLAVKLNLTSKAFDISDDKLQFYLATLEASIINQTSLYDAQRLRLPVTIFYGALDPVVIGSHIRSLARLRANITAKRLISGHEVQSTYAKALAKELNTLQNKPHSKISTPTS